MAGNRPPVSERNPERDEESGQFDDRYADETFLSAVRALDGAGTVEIAERVGCDRRTAYLRLTELEERGEISGEKIGNAYLWTIDG